MIVLRKPNIFLYSATLEGNDNFCKEMNCLDRFHLLAQDQACFLKSLYYDALKRNCLSPFVPHLSLLWHFYFNRNTPRVRYWRRRRHVRREAVREVRSQANHRIRNRKSFMAHRTTEVNRAAAIEPSYVGASSHSPYSDCQGTCKSLPANQVDACSTC